MEEIFECSLAAASATYLSKQRVKQEYHNEISQHHTMWCCLRKWWSTGGKGVNASDGHIPDCRHRKWHHDMFWESVTSSLRIIKPTAAVIVTKWQNHLIRYPASFCRSQRRNPDGLAHFPTTQSSGNCCGECLDFCTNPAHVAAYMLDTKYDRNILSSKSHHHQLRKWSLFGNTHTSLREEVFVLHVEWRSPIS